MPGGCCSGLLVAVLLASPVVASHTEGDAPGRYAHCAEVFAGRMIVYGGRGFEDGRNSLTTLG